MAIQRQRILVVCVLVVLSQCILSTGVHAAALEDKTSAVTLEAVEPKSPIVDSPVYTVTKIEEVSWADTFRRALEGPTGQMVVHIAKEVIARQVGGTQVLSLNLTNLLILLFLKAIIFAAGLIGAGSWGQYARSLDNGRPVIDFGDASMMMGFLAAQGSGQHKNCLYRAACEYPEAAVEYAQAGHATLTGVQIFSKVPLDRHYEKMLNGIEQAAKEGLRNLPCSLMYKCDL